MDRLGRQLAQLVFCERLLVALVGEERQHRFGWEGDDDGGQWDHCGSGSARGERSAMVVGA